MKITLTKIKAHSSIELNEKVDSLAKYRITYTTPTQINSNNLNSIKYHITQKSKIIDLPLSTFYKKYITINHLIQWKIQYRNITIINVTITKSTDWQITKEILMHTKLTDPFISANNKTLRTFKIKLFTDKLPTKQKMHEKCQEFYVTDTCIKCN